VGVLTSGSEGGKGETTARDAEFAFPTNQKKPPHQQKTNSPHPPPKLLRRRGGGAGPREAWCEGRRMGIVGLIASMGNRTPSSAFRSVRERRKSRERAAGGHKPKWSRKDIGK